MIVTVVTLYRGQSCETYVAAIEGETTWEQERKIAQGLNLKTEDGEALDSVGFSLVDVRPGTASFLTFFNAFPEPYRTWTGVEEALKS